MFRMVEGAAVAGQVVGGAVLTDALPAYQYHMHFGTIWPSLL